MNPLHLTDPTERVDEALDLIHEKASLLAGDVYLAPLLHGEPNFALDGKAWLEPDPYSDAMTESDMARLCVLTTGFHRFDSEIGFDGAAVLTHFDSTGQAHFNQIGGSPSEFAKAVAVLERGLGGAPLMGTPTAANDNHKAVRATPFVLRDPAKIPMREWLYGQHYIRSFMTVTVGAGGGGKSSNAVPETLSMVTGRPLLGGLPIKPLSVWYINLEDPASEIERRFGAAIKHHKVNAGQLADRLYIDSGRDQEFVVVKQAGRETRIVQPVVAGLIAEIKGRGIDVLVVDPFVSTHEVPENDNTLIQRVAEQWVRIADEANCSVELIHHVRKTSEEVGADDARGAGALKDKARSLRVINAMSEAEAGRAGVAADDRFDYFRIDAGKANMQRRGGQSLWRHFVSVNLGNGRGNLNPGDNVGVVEEWNWPAADALVADVTPEQLDAIRTRIAAGDFRESSQASDWAGVIVAEVLGLEADDKQVKTRITRMLAAWTKGGHFQVVTELDVVTRKVKKFLRVKAAPLPHF